MEERVKKLAAELVKLEKAMADLHSNKRIDDATFAKVMISIAHDHACIVKAYGEAARIIKIFTQDYYDGAFTRQCEEDATFREAAYETALALVDAGMADVGPKYQFSQPPAQA